MRIIVRHKVIGTVLEIYRDSMDQPGSIYDFEAAGFSTLVAKALVRSFVALQGGNTLASQRAIWIQIRRFGGFCESKFGKPNRLPPDCLENFGNWLEEQGLGISATGATYNTVVRMLQWCLRNAPAVIHPGTYLQRLPYASRFKKSLEKSLPVHDKIFVKNVLKACYSEIEEIEDRIKAAKKFLVSQDSSEIVKLLRELIIYGDGFIASQEQILRQRGGTTILTNLKYFGGLRAIHSRFYLTPRDVLPFYLAVLIQTSANPQSLLRADRDCIVRVPMRDDLERVVWDKLRAGKEQAVDFPKNKEWAAPNIIRRLNKLNNELRTLALPSNSDALFLCWNKSGNISAPSWQGIHNKFKEFRSRHSLPQFELRNMRVAGAVLHHKAARSLSAAKHRLGHESESTTQRYSSLADNREFHDKVIFRFQGLLVSESVKLSHDAISLGTV